jgi:hypothetical protein
MALPKTIERLDDVPEMVREHYSEKDGVLTLTLMASEDHTGLVNALNDERRLRRDTERQLTDMKTKFEGVDPDDYHKLQDRVKGLDDADIYDKQGIEALVLRRTESMKSEHERQSRAMEREIAQLKDTVSTTDKKWRSDRIRTALLEAVNQAGVYEKAVNDAVQRGFSVFTDLDDHGNVVARNGDDVRYGKDGVNPLTPGEWIQSVKASGDAPHLWPPSSGGGAPAHHGAGNSGIDWNSITNPAERLTRFREWEATQKR